MSLLFFGQPVDQLTALDYGDHSGTGVQALTNFNQPRPATPMEELNQDSSVTASGLK
jgi:hypothetical protein